MARRSIDTRMDRIVDKILPPGSIERREYELPEHLRCLLQMHRQRVGEIISRAESRGEGEAYRRLADGEISFPPMPPELAKALRLPDAPVLTADMNAAEVAEAWDQFRKGDQ